MEMKYLALIVWFVACVWLGVRGSVKFNDAPVHPVFAPLVVLFVGFWYAVIAVACLAPWIWLIWP